MKLWRALSVVLLLVVAVCLSGCASLSLFSSPKTTNHYHNGELDEVEAQLNALEARVEALEAGQ